MSPTNKKISCCANAPNKKKPGKQFCYLLGVDRVTGLEQVIFHGGGNIGSNTSIGRSFVMARFFLIFLASFFVFSNADAEELIVPLSDSEYIAAADINDYFLRKHLYSAKQHRIVRVDFDVLFSEKPLQITFFPEETIEVVPTGIERRGEGSIIRWKGELQDSTGVLERQASQISAPEAREAFRALSSKVRITAAKFEHDKASRANFPYYADGELSKVTLESERSQNTIYYGVRTRVMYPGSSREFVLMPLEMGGPYHLIYELDRSKIPRISDRDAVTELDPETAAKIQARQDFMRTLGEDPRKEIIRSRQGQKQ